MGCNPAFEELFGYSLEEIEGRETSVVYDEPEEFRAMGEELRRNMEDPNFLFTVNYRKKSGDVFPGETNVFHFENAQGELEGFIGLIRDVTERRNLEAQLRQAQKMEAVGQLTGGIAHDFNNELSVIQLNTELLRSALELEQTPDLADLEAVENATKRAARMTRQLLGFSRRAELELEETDLATLVRDLRKLLQRAVTERIRLVMECQEDVPFVLVDPGSIEQALMNVVNNARDAMSEEGRVAVSVREVELGGDYVSEHPYAEPGRYVRIAVEDTGTGMAPEVQEKVFEPFFTTKPAGSGTGLGLSMVYGLVKQQGGHVDIRSERGEGTTVAIFLPVLEVPAKKEPAEGRGGEDGRREKGGTETILVVEDEEPVRATARRALQRKGYAVLTAEDGRAGLDLFREHARDIDLVFTDLIMPEMGGGELIQTIREEDPDVRFILSSGYSGELSRERRRTSWAADVPFLRKPWSLADLLKQVREVLDDDDGG
jgi:PAS domain S-box-containing protein